MSGEQREIPEFDDDSDEPIEEKEDEKPTVVVLKPGDLTADEATKEEKLQKEKEDKELIEQRKITFKTLKKRTSEKPKDGTSCEASENKKIKKNSVISKTESVKQKQSLLSFGDDEDEGDVD